VWIKGLAAFWRYDKTREAIGVLAMAVAVLTLAALATFDPHDPCFFTFASMTDRQVRNAVGRVGAEVGGDLLGLLGLSALFVPPGLFWWGWAWVGGRRLFQAGGGGWACSCWCRRSACWRPCCTSCTCFREAGSSDPADTWGTSSSGSWCSSSEPLDWRCWR
jgi:hypothetical protein